MTTRLRAMTEAEIASRIGATRDSYVAQRVRAGESEAAARERARVQFAEFLPGGSPAPGHRFWAVEESGEVVGHVWVGPHPQRPEDPTAAWLLAIEVDEALRGRGHGRAALEALEAELAGAGVAELGLNVFAGNDTARRLYETAGYEERAVSMSKTLG